MAIHLGTSGYSYAEWKGTFYADDASVEQFLPLYAQQLRTVEINNTYYRFPTEKLLDDWLAQTDDSFLFAVKANQRISHRHRLKNVEEVTREFTERCQRLGPRLGPILIQLPPQMACNEQRLATFLEHIPQGVRYTLEFRHKSWFTDAVFAQLRAANVAFCVSDDNKLDCPRELTADFTYVRLRRDDYDKESLNNWRQWLAELDAAGRDAYVYLKHDEGGRSPVAILEQLT